MRIVLLNIFLFTTTVIFAQVTQKSDSILPEKLEEVIVTGQINPQSVSKSVVEIKVISRKDIERQAGNTLADVLNTTLNLTITPNTSTGKSGVSLFGLDSQYFKVLIDNIPIINEEGVGNNTDLTLINLDDIERIEIVEGAMGVQYGSNAVSGIINIITKKSSRNDWDITAYVQEETVGSEYEWFDKGRHIQSLKVGHNFSENFYANAVYTRNDFAGFFNDRQGENYDVNDGLRGHEWLPKLQQNTKALLAYKKENFNLFYRFDYLNERIERYNETVDLNENAATATTNPSALDEIYTNNRLYHHVNGTGTIFKKIAYNVSVSYQEQTKDLERYTYRIRSGQQENIEEGEYQSRSAFFSRGTFSNIINTSKVNLQLGYELTNEKGSGSSLAIVIGPESNEVTQKLNNYDFFAASELQLTSRFSLRPGFRASFSNLFEAQYIGSLSAKQTLGDSWELRAILGSANRTPNYNELYTFFVDVNHNVQGNPALKPEKGYSAFLHIKKRSTLANSAIRLKNKLSFNYLGLQDRIELIVVNQSPLAFQYNNIDRFRAVGVFSENEIFYKNFKGQLGASVQGVSKVLDSNTQSNDDFLFNLQLNSNLAYTAPKWNTTFSVFFKHIGKQQQFVEKTNAEGNQEFVQGETEAYSWIDATINKSFFDGAFITTVGARNLFDVTQVNTTAFEGGAHNGPPTQISLGYGRSYFLKLTYNLSL
ncbi:TonB-dependent receptor plug domain-containing protein [Rasiella rasia]|uniref:TonB-dependent receptor plug domain-containing protein n=1 Tax=Rasiella rasia TaxID=2744027 RepID=A0A6G6GK34_9FLAO|nr:TonB-dependent receptor plug domain-containing protein [Rasiella rasia]QIE58912.1 TonB-dependent receptor plug domain-containing protein [Rasiella rasia]